MNAYLEKIKELKPDKSNRYTLGDIGNGCLFADLVKGQAIYIHERKKWYYYDGARWKEDTENSAYVMRMCKDIANDLGVYAYALADFSTPDDKKSYLSKVVKWQALKYRETILKEASTIEGIVYSFSMFDRNPYLLNCTNVTIDLEKLEVREHNPEDLITMMAGVKFDPKARSNRWDKFIDEVTCGDKELAEYLQKKAGYWLTGCTELENLDILYGATTRNGKGTFCETLVKLLGDYACTANPETLAARKSPDSRSASGDLARLKGKRFVNVSEPEKNTVINAPLVKSLTGNDTIVARHLYEKEIEFKSQAKFLINTNYLPTIEDPTLFTSERIKVIPFDKHFSEAERDPELKKKLTTPENLSGILRWCIEGWGGYQQKGLITPKAVKEATDDYKKISDKISLFIGEALIKAPGGEVATLTVFTEYKKWCIENKEQSESMNAFRKSLASAGIKPKRARPKGSDRTANKTSIIYGYCLKSPTV